MNKITMMTMGMACLYSGLTVQADSSIYKDIDGYYAYSSNETAAEVFNADNYNAVYYRRIDIQAASKASQTTLIANNTTVITNRIEMMNVLTSYYKGKIELVNNGIIRDYSDEDPLENTMQDNISLVTNQNMLILIATGSFINNGTLGLDINMTKGGTITLNDGSNMAGMNATMGTVNVNGAISADGSFTLGQNLVMNFTKDSYIDMQGSLLTADNALTINMYVSEYDSGKELVLFRNVADGSTTTFNVNIIDDSGNVLQTVTGTVGATNMPEPTTATLSLLALAALAARRRRR